MLMSGGAASADRFSLSRRTDGGKRRVLYAEDQTTTRVVTTALLERMGFDVVAVEDGELAVEEARAAAYDLILMDIEMPVMDGVTAARSIRATDGPCRGVPILALSAFLADSTEHSVWRDAFDSALPKPVTSSELQAAMQRAIAASAPEPKAANQTGAWANIGRNLPKGTLSALAKAAREQMEHLVLAMSSCAEAGDHEHLQKCRKGLEQLMQSFGASGVQLALPASGSPFTCLDAQEALQAIAEWHRKQATWH